MAVAANPFTGNAFTVQSLTGNINKIPQKPRLLGELGIFKMSGVRTRTVIVEEKHGKISILPTAAPGTMETTGDREDRQVRTFRIPYIPKNDTIMAEDVQDIRAFGSETEMETVAQVVADRLASIKDDFEVTWEFHRIGAVHGIVQDSDMSTTLFNFYTEFDITPNTVAFDFADTGDYDNAAPAEDLKDRTLAVIRIIEDALGGTPFTGITAICGDTFFDNLIKHATVRRAYETMTSNAFGREQQFRRTFPFAGIDWINYRGAVGGTPFVAATIARAFPTGAGNLFEQINAPGTFSETVNTKGLPIYVKQERLRFDVGTELHAQSSPLFICNRPAALCEITTA